MYIILLPIGILTVSYIPSASLDRIFDQGDFLRFFEIGRLDRILDQGSLKIPQKFKTISQEILECFRVSIAP